MTIAATTGKFAGQGKAVLGQQPAKLFIGGISKNTTTEVLRRHFCRYGRVLDCVAIRREDGSPRGFGYVTLDSTQAADCCLAQPQVIDGRVVDLKHAVPEGSMEIAQKAAGLWARDLFARKQQNPLALLSTPAPPVDTDNDILSMASPMMWPVHAGLAHWAVAFNGVCPESSPDCMELLSTSPTHQDAGSRSALLSTQPAPLEHWQAESSPEISEHGSNLMSASAPEFIPQADSADKACEKDLPKRAALGDITNTQGQGPLANMPNSLKKKIAPPIEIFTDENAMTAVGMQSPTGLTSPPGLSPQETNLSLVAEDTKHELQAEGADSLPSMGSVGHAAGTCKLCNFFAKGRCQNGKSCSFCHFSHDKPKMKRDRAQLSPRGATDDAQQMMAYPLLVSPLGLHGDYSNLAHSTIEVAAPPGLTQQTGFGHEPVPAVSIPLQPGGVTSPNSSAFMSPLQGCALLSTTPMASPCTSLQPAHNKAEESPAVPEKSSACTQTEEVFGDAIALQNDDASCVSREDFLRLRPISDASNFGIRTVQK